MKQPPEPYTYVVVTRGFYKGHVAYVTETFKASRSSMIRITHKFTGTDGEPRELCRHIERAWSSLRIARPEEVEA